MLGKQCAATLVTGTDRKWLLLQELSSMSYDGYAYENVTSFALVLAWPTPSTSHLNKVKIIEGEVSPKS